MGRLRSSLHSFAPRAGEGWRGLGEGSARARRGLAWAGKGWRGLDDKLHSVPFQILLMPDPSLVMASCFQQIVQPIYRKLRINTSDRRPADEGGVRQTEDQFC